MAAMKPHTTPTSDNSWDGPANEARFKKDATDRKAFAWQDPNGAAHKFLHHEVDAEGGVGAANVRACQAGIALLNGGRGGTIIPKADRRGAYNHLARHLREADVEPPELRQLPDSLIEQRCFHMDSLEVRQGTDDEAPQLVGHAAVFDQVSEPLWGFREVIRPGAFTKTLKDGADVRSFWNHNSDFVLGRISAETLRLAEDKTGLACEIDPPPTVWANDLLKSIDRGDVDEMSIGFRTMRENWITEDAEPLRELLEVRLVDASPVAMAAYPQTDIQLRALETASAKCGINVRRLLEVLCHGEPGELGTEELDVVRSWVTKLESYIGPEKDSPVVNLRRRRLDLAARRALSA